MMQEKNTNLKSISISVASPDDVLSWSYGEVTKPETLNYRTQRPEKDGLFSERIFGPTKDYECYCGKYKKVRYKGVTCEKCGVEVTRAVVRRERMGHITLSTPVAHVWFLKTAPSKLSLFLNISVPKLEKVIYYAAFIVTNVNEEHKKRALQELDKEFKALKGGEGENDKMLKEKHSRVKEAISSLKTGLILSEAEYHTLSEKFGDVFEADQGASAIRKMLERIDLEVLVKQLEKELVTATDSIRQKRILLRLKLAQSFLRNRMRPEWMVMTVLPILPPELRPMVALDGGNYATADLNDLYSRVINRNNRLKKLIELHAPEVILTNEKRMLQEAVDALIDNSSRAGSQLLSTKRRPLRSLADILKGKQGRFRQNLLGKRVDYSGRSVIVVGPELRLNECGLPKHMALELFRPFVIQKIIERGYAYNIKQANRLIEQETPEIWAILEEVIKNRKVLLNRAPTLHRLGIQAFNPILVEGMAIRIPPLVCSAFNADFDGDQMGVHLPLTVEAQAESNIFMDAGKNLLKPANGNPIVSPSQDMVLGAYFLTREIPEAKGEGSSFSSFEEAQLAFDSEYLEIGARIKVLHNGGIQETTLGRLIFNNILPKEVGFINEKLDKKGLEKVVSKIIELCGIEHASQYIDAIKTLGYKYATQSAVTWSMWDTVIPKDKGALMKESEEKVKGIEEQYEEGLLTKEERKERIVRIWMDTREKISKMLPSAFDFYNPIFMIVDSKSRGSWAQPIQMMGMKGNVNDPKGEVIELPIKSSYKEGFSVLEYFVSTHGSRKGTTDTALKTAQAGYLTRRLVDVSQDLVIREEDCGCEEGIEVFRADGDEFGYAFGDRIYSRTVLEDVVIDKKVVVKANEPITREAADAIQKSKLESIIVRSPITCKTLYGICSKCYGYDLSKNKPIRLGEAVGVIAAQSIGEPGTQLTMRTFHTGGIAGTDITHGLPRVEEIFEARPPKGKAPLARAKGVLEEIEERGLSWVLKVHETETVAGEQKKRGKKLGSQMVDYFVPAGVRLLVKKGDIVEKGQQLCEGSLDLKEILAYRGIESLRRYIINEVQKVYIPAGSPINDKHIEIIVRQMLARVAIKESGETEFMVGETVDKSHFIFVNRSARGEKKEIAKAVQKVFGITRVALTTESFLSAASFQETARVLVDAAVRRKKDILRGLKENVIIGKLIPVGSGLSGIPAEILEELKEKLTGKPEIDTLTLSQEN